MLRISDRGIPPHMLHLYEQDAGRSPKSKLQDSASGLPSVLAKVGSHLWTGLIALRSQPKSESFAPDSAKRAEARPCETQYLGEAQLRDTRWRAS